MDSTSGSSKVPRSSKISTNWKKCNERQLFGSLALFEHLPLTVSKLLQASYQSLSTCTNSMADTTSDMALSHLCMLSTHFLIHNMQKITLHTKPQPPNSPTSNLKSPIKDVNERLNGVRQCFNPLFPLFSPGSSVVDHFPSRFSFYSPLSSSNEDLYHHLQNLDQAFRSSQMAPYNIAIIANRGIKKLQVATTVTHI